MAKTPTVILPRKDVEQLVAWAQKAHHLLMHLDERRGPYTSLIPEEVGEALQAAGERVLTSLQANRSDHSSYRGWDL